MAKNKIIRSYHGLSDAQFGDFGLHIANALAGNATFPTPPTTAAALTTQTDAYITAVAACLHGTPSDTLAKNTQRTALITTLDTLATYVELTANNDPAKILSAGFSLQSPATHNPAVPEPSSILAVTNEASGKLRVNLAVGKNAWAYFVEYTAVPGGTPKLAGFTNPHDAVLAGLTPGTNYSLRVQVMGSANQTTDWSDAVQHMST